MPDDPLAVFSPAVREWFRTTFTEPTTAQWEGWPAIASGEHALILAPTGSGKTLTAFLWAIDRLMTAPAPKPDERLRVVYVSPLKALAVDVDKNLRAPLRGIALAAERLGIKVTEPTVGVRTGDTPSSERARMVRRPPDILITTPESLFLMLTSRARERLRHVEAVIVDEIHALAPTKRGTHLALTLERLEHEVLQGQRASGSAPRPPQRIALSATQRPLDEIARFLGGQSEVDADAQHIEPRPVTVVDAGVRKPLELEVVVPVEDMGELGRVAEPADVFSADLAATRTSIWPSIHPRLLDLVLEHRSTLVFVNSRRLAERLSASLNELHVGRIRADALRAAGFDALQMQEAVEAGDDVPPDALAILDRTIPDLVLAHHGSLSRERRLLVEDELKSGRLRGLVATSSLELGIDMGAIDLVVQVSSPGAVSRGLQRIGRAGHQVGQPSRGKFFPKYRGDLLETAVVTRRMRDGAIESTHYPRLPLDVLAQQIVAMVAMDDWGVDDLHAVVRRAAPFADLGEEVFASVLDLLSGRFPSDEFSELRPRVVWDRIAGVVSGRPGAQRLAVTNPGTIPDRGLFGVFLPDGTRVGELDEEMVHESRAGETFLLGASTWRIEDITFDRVVVTPAPGQPGKMPFWHGDGPGRPYELGAAIGEFVRTVRGEDPELTRKRLQDEHDLDGLAARNLMAYLDEQAEATTAVPDDRTIVVERFRDELGDWRICVLSPFGAQVHAPWAMALERQMTLQGADPEIMWADDGIVIRLQEAFEDLDLDALVPDPDEVETLVTEQLAGTALFTTVFREAAGRALLLPKRRPGQRTALWQQRQRAANLLQVASKYPTFPILLEATRECLRDVFDVSALQRLLRDVRSRTVRLVPVDSDHASPFAQSLLFSWVGQWMYDYDAPLAERRAAALSLDPDLLRELLGGDELRELIDADVLAALELELQHLPPLEAEGSDRRATSPDGLHDVLRDVGDLTIDEVAARSADPSRATSWVAELESARRAVRLRVADQDRIAAAEDAARLRDGLGVALPPGLPAAFTEPVDDPLGDLVSRYARTHGPFTVTQVAHRLGAPRERVQATLLHLARQDRVVEGAFRPDGIEREWCDVTVLRRLKRRSLAALRRDVEPVDAATYGRFLLSWHGVVGPPRRGPDALAETIAQLQGVAMPASALESDILPARLEVYRPADLDLLLATGDLVWFGAGTIGARDGKVVLAYRDAVAALAPPPSADHPTSKAHDGIRRHLATAGASFWPQILAAVGIDEQVLLDALWDLVWAGQVTNDGLAALRSLRSRRRGSTAARGRVRSGRVRRTAPASAAGRWSLTATIREPTMSDTARAHALAEQLLERQGVVTAEGVRAEGVPGGFASIYPVLKAMEEVGTVRRGYVVEGLGGAQFSTPGVVDRLRTHRDTSTDEVVILAATDPAQPYGAALAWPPSPGDRRTRPRRAAGSLVVLVGGAPVLYVERSGRSLVTFDETDPAVHAGHLPTIVEIGRRRRLQIARIDGVDVHGTPWSTHLRDVGFVAEPKGLVLRSR